jgi:hypothetical protein
VSFFWLEYRHHDGRFAGIVVLEATALIIARMHASVFGLDEGLYFANGHQLDTQSGRQIPSGMVGRLLGDGDLRRLQRAIAPVAPSMPRQTVAKRSATKR